MKHFKYLLVLLVLLAGTFFSCQKAPFIILNSNRSFTYSRNGGSQSISFSTNREWSIASSETWCNVSPSLGIATNGDITVTVSVDKNTTYDARTCLLTLKAEDLSEKIIINQEPGLGIIISPTTLELSNEAQEFEISIQKNISYKISIDDNCIDWVKFIETKALTAEKVVFEIAANLTYDNREGLIHFIQDDGVTIDVRVVQKQSDLLYLTNGTSNSVISYKEQIFNIGVMSNMEYEVSVDVDWISIISTKGLQNTNIELLVEDNPSFDKRLGLVTIKPTNSLYNQQCQITQRGKPIDLSQAGTANCYIVPLKDSTYCFNSAIAGNDVYQNSFRITGGTHAGVVWESPYDISSYGLIENINYEPDNNRIVFDTKKAGGNALVALFDENNSILWSWHIWMTDYDPALNYTTFSNGIVLQDRYLGAKSDDGIGLYYQWGRKDPFSPGKYTRITPEDESGTVAYSISHPDVFLSVNYDLTNWDWNYEHTANWSSTKTVHDPCPAGWKVMDGNPFFLPEWPTGYVAEFSNNCMILTEPICTPDAKFRTNGLLHTAGHIQGTNESILVWTNYGTYSRFYVGKEMIAGKGVSTELIGRAYGDNVRCQRE